VVCGLIPVRETWIGSLRDDFCLPIISHGNKKKKLISTKSVTCNNGTKRYGFCSGKFQKLFSLVALTNLIFSVITDWEVSEYNEILQGLYKVFYRGVDKSLARPD